MPSLDQQRTQKYIADRQQNTAWLLLSSRRAPLMLSCLEALFEHQRDGVPLDNAVQALADYQKLVRNLALASPADSTTDANAALLATHHQAASAALQRLDVQQAKQTAATETAVMHERNAHAELARLQAEHDAVRQRPGSNLPVEFQPFRAALADALQLAPDDLPFAAELIEVRKDEQAWRGAIERALGSHRLRILVPPQAMQAALRWVNQRHSRLHVRLLAVQQHRSPNPAPAPAPAAFWSDGFCRKFNLKPHAHQHALHKLLADLDRH